MMISLICTLFAVAPLQADPALESIRAHHLDLAEGRSQFLLETLQQGVNRAQQLNLEMMDLASRIQQLSGNAANQGRILELTKKLNEQMALLEPYLPILQASLSIEDDFQHLGGIGNGQNLTQEQRAAIDRVAALCRALDELPRQ